MAEKADTDRLKELIGEELVERIEGLEGKAAEVVEKLQSADGADVEELRTQLGTVTEELSTLQAERTERLHDAERKAMTAKITSLNEAIEELRKPGSTDDFSFSGGAPTPNSDTKAAEFYGPEGEHSFWNDVRLSVRGDRKAAQRLEEISAEGKAMVEGTGSAGGFLVPDQISSEILELRQANSNVRPLVSKVQVTSDKLRIAAVTGGLTAGWVAELATKPQADMTFGEIEAGVYEIAGLAVASNQLLRDSARSVDSLVNADLARRIATVEEVGIIDGTGTGQPTGILGTAGVQTVALTSTAVADLLDAVLDAITLIYTNFFGPPNAILMHPRTWARLVKAKTTTGAYMLGGPDVNGRTATNSLPGYGQAAVPQGVLFGLPVYTSPNIPVNKGAGTNESRVIVGAFNEALILDREGIQFDKSEHVYFTSNQTVFRAEEAVGFTAARYPKAFAVVQGAGLANG